MRSISMIFYGICFMPFLVGAAISYDSIPPATLSEYFQGNTHLQPQTIEDGLQYVLSTEGRGNKPTNADYVKIYYRVMTLDSTILDYTEVNDPFVFKFGESYEFEGLDKGIAVMNKGASATFFVASRLAYEKGRQHYNQPLIVEIQLLDILNLEAYDRYMIELEEKAKIAFQQSQSAQYQKDMRLVKSYAKENKLKIKQTKSGLGYVITKKGKGASAIPGNTVKVVYEGFLTDNTPIEKNASKEPFEFKLGIGKVMEGWEEGLQYFNKGAEGWLLIPSKMAYGPMSIQEANISIPANAVLVFKIKVLGIE